MSVDIGVLTGSEFFFGLWPKHFKLSEAERRVHSLLSGRSGMGKSLLMKHMYEQELHQGQPVSLIDPHGSTVDDVLRDLIEVGYFNQPGAYDRLRWVEFSDSNDYYYPFNVLNVPWANDDRTADLIVESFHRAYPVLAQGAANFDLVIGMGVKLLIDNQLPLTSLAEVLLNDDYRKSLYPRLTRDIVRTYFEQHYDKLSQFHQESLTASSKNRAIPLADKEVINYSLCQPGNSLDLFSFLEQGKSLLIDLSGLPTALKRFFGALITHTYEEAAKHRRPYSSPTHNLYLDEFATFSAQSAEALGHILEECRKYNLFLTMTHQTWGQAPPRLASALQNAGLKVSFAVGQEDAEIQAKIFGEITMALPKAVNEKGYTTYATVQDQYTAWAQALYQLKVGQCLIKVGAEPAIHVTTHPPRKSTVTDAQLQAVKNSYYRLHYTHKDNIAPPQVTHRRGLRNS